MLFQLPYDSKWDKMIFDAHSSIKVRKFERSQNHFDIYFYLIKSNPETSKIPVIKTTLYFNKNLKLLPKTYFLFISPLH